MNIIKITIAVVVLALLGGGTFIYMDMAEQERIAEEKRVREQQALEEKNAREQALAARTKCTKADNYLVVTMDRDGTVGQDILVKKNASDSGSACSYDVTEGDFELKNSDPQYFKALVKKAMVVDVGTGPSGRNLRIYDLGDKSIVAEKEYFGELSIASGTLSYFGLAKQKADKKNCKEYDSLMKDFGNANLVTEKLVNLDTYMVKETKNTKCVARQ